MVRNGRTTNARGGGGRAPGSRYRTAEQRLFADAGIEPTEHWIDLPNLGVTARVLEVGEGTPTVFLHQGNHGAAAWAYAAAAVTGVRCLLVDYPGCGLSAPLPTIPAVEEVPAYLAHLPLDVLEGLGLDRACLVGASIGGQMALRAAATGPDRIDRLLLAGCPALVPGSTQPLIMNLLLAPLLARLMLAAPPSAASIRANLWLLGHRRSLRDRRIPPPLVYWSRAVFGDTDTVRNECALYRPGCDWRGHLDPGLWLNDDDLAAVQAPCAIVAGAADPTGGPEVMRHLADRLPASELDVLPDAGHFPWFDDPARVAARISSFLGADTEPPPRSM